MKKKKLLIVTTVPQTLFYILEGQPKFLSEYYDVSIITSSGPELSLIRARENVPVHEINMHRKISLLSDLLCLYQLYRLLLKLSPEIVHSYTPKAGLLTMLAAFFARVKVRVHTFTGLIFPSRNGVSKALLIATDKLTCLCSTTVVAESEGVRDDLKAVGIPDESISIIGSGNIAGVDENNFSPVPHSDKISQRVKFGIPSDAFVFCYVGRLNAEKGVTELVRAFQQLRGDVYLILAGGSDETSPLPSEIITIIRSHPNILSFGQMSDVRSVFGSSDVNVLTSHREGFPNVLLEACSMGLPSIATDVNGSREVISNGKTGWLIPIKNTQAVLDAMISSMNERDQLYKLGCNCRKLIIQKYRRRDYLEKLKIFYKRLHVDT